MRIIVGLGNPGDRYRCTRHNVGFRCIDLLSQRWAIKLSERRAKAILGRGRHQEQDIILAKPRAFMNLSGQGVAYLLTRFAAKPADLVVIYDEMDLPVGKLRLRPGGGPAGHNGIRSIITEMKTTDFPRIRIGIGHPALGQEQVSHVLSRFSPEEAPEIARIVEQAAAAIDCLLESGIDTAMNRFN